MTLTTVESIPAPLSLLFTGTTASDPVRDNSASEVVLAKTLNFELVQSEIDLTWSLLNLANGLEADSRYRDAGRVIQRVKCALQKAEIYAGDLEGPERSEASYRLRLLKDVIATIAAS